jgi:hypothetical protein
LFQLVAHHVIPGFERAKIIYESVFFLGIFRESSTGVSGKAAKKQRSKGLWVASWGFSLVFPAKQQRIFLQSCKEAKKQRIMGLLLGGFFPGVFGKEAKQQKDYNL